MRPVQKPTNSLTTGSALMRALPSQNRAQRRVEPAASSSPVPFSPPKWVSWPRVAISTAPTKLTPTAASWLRRSDWPSRGTLSRVSTSGQP